MRETSQPKGTIMNENVTINHEVPETSPKLKFDLKKVAKITGAASIVVLVAVGAYKLGASSDVPKTDENVPTHSANDAPKAK